MLMNRNERLFNLGRKLFLSQPKILDVFLVALLFALYTLWKFSPAFTDGYTISDSYGDGIGTIGWYSALVDQETIYNYSIKQQKENTDIDVLGGGLYSPILLNSLNRNIVLVLSEFSKEDNIYDLFGAVGFYCSAVVLFWVLIRLKIPLFISFMMAIAIVNMDNTLLRLTGHLQLSMYFFPVLLTYFTWMAAKENNLKYYLFSSISLVFTFMMNEYYGYFGLYFSFLLFFVGVLYHKTYIHYKSILLNGLLGGVLLTVLMFYFYPTYVGYNILNIDLANHEVIATSNKHTFEDYKAFSAKDMSYFFHPASVFETFFPDFEYTKIPEQTYRIGFVVIIFIFSSLLFFCIKRDLAPIRLFIFSIPLMLVTYSLGDYPDSAISMVEFSYHISKSFRVGVRAHFYLLLWILFLYCFLSNFLLKHLQKKIWFGVIIVNLFSFLVMIDISDNNWMKQVKTYKLPINEAYDVLATYKRGRVIELPIYYEPEFVPEKFYQYKLNRAFHHHVTLNARPATSDIDLFNAYKEFARYFNSCPRINNDLMMQLGVNYIVIDKNVINCASNMKLPLLYENKEKAIYMANSSFSEHSIDLREEIINNRDMFSSYNDMRDLESAKLAPVGKVTNFSQFTKGMTTTGFSGYEAQGRWTDGNESKLFFSVERRYLNNKNLRLLIDLTTYTDGHYGQDLTIYLNSQVIFSDSMIRERELHLDIDVYGLLDESNLIRILTPRAISPNELTKKSDDIRSLGVMINNIGIVNE